eukprot:GFKZ01005519.1.p1 GENE.GFKZ01005519.1~~GFKZ01005519.1.p1  ORF type:complete len:170 (+),score=6.50 GFKZ01005519.1:717-1226(+)
MHPMADHASVCNRRMTGFTKRDNRLLRTIDSIQYAGAQSDFQPSFELTHRTANANLRPDPLAEPRPGRQSNFTRKVAADVTSVPQKRSESRRRVQTRCCHTSTSQRKRATNTLSSQTPHVQFYPVAATTADVLCVQAQNATRRRARVKAHSIEESHPADSMDSDQRRCT